MLFYNFSIVIISDVESGRTTKEIVFSHLHEGKTSTQSRNAWT